MQIFKRFTYALTAVTLIVFFAFLIWIWNFILNNNFSTEIFSVVSGFIILLIILTMMTVISWDILESRYGWSLKVAINKYPGIAKYLLPSFDELSIFIMSYSFFFLLVVNDVFKSDLYKFLFHASDPRMIILFVVLCVGIILSTYHLFSSRNKTRFEKWIMLYSVVTVNVIIGLNAIIYALDHPNEFTIFFAIWNLANGFLLLTLMRGSAVDASAVSDWNASIYMSIVSVAIVSIIAISCQYYFKLYWLFSLSITIAYSTTINSFIIKLIQRFSKTKNYDFVTES